jgi:hypothetical protein
MVVSAVALKKKKSHNTLLKWSLNSKGCGSLSFLYTPVSYTWHYLLTEILCQLINNEQISSVLVVSMQYPEPIKLVGLQGIQQIK